MNEKEIAKSIRLLRENLAAEGERIRRYSMDPFLKEPDKLGEPDPGKPLREQLQAVWDILFAMKAKLRTLRTAPTVEAIHALEAECEQLARKVDLVQRELISEESYEDGIGTVRWMLITLLVLFIVYMMAHGVWSLDFSTFEPWPEWGPMKYGEVAFWSMFGALCALLFKAAHYLSRRDFDGWYKPWYVTTFIRAPFLTVVLMLIVLEFVEWYGQGTWIETYLLEEGSKFYFIVFLSFCLGLTTDTTSGIMRDLSDGVSEFVARAAGRVSDKLGTAVSKE